MTPIMIKITSHQHCFNVFMFQTISLLEISKLGHLACALQNVFFKELYLNQC